jgi:hypothetical protein
MQITIYQAEIEDAIRTHIHNVVSVKDGHEIKIDLKATRGDTGFQAIIDIEPVVTNGAKPMPTRPAQRVVAAAPAAPKPVITTADLKRMHEKEAAEEALAEAEAAPEPEAPVEEEALPEAAGVEEGEEAVPEAAPEAVPQEAQRMPLRMPAKAPDAAPARPATQVAGAQAGAAGAPSKRLFAGFSRPSNSGS